LWPSTSITYVLFSACSRDRQLQVVALMRSPFLSPHRIFGLDINIPAPTLASYVHYAATSALSMNSLRHRCCCKCSPLQ